MTKPVHTVVFAMLVLFITLTACEKTNISFGEQFIDNDYTKIVKTDTFAVNVSTVYIDSFATSASGTGLAGVYRDNLFGLVKASSFMLLAPPADEDIYSNTIYDSTRLVIKLKRTWYGDTLKPVHLAVYRVTDEIAFPSGATQFYNTTSFATGSTPIGEKVLYLRPTGIDSTISINISDVLGQEWLTMLQNRSDDIRVAENFQRYFKGISIAATGDDGVVFGFQDSAHIDLHYSKKDLVKQDKVASFTLSNNSKQFNHISVDRTGTVLQSIGSSNKEISSSLTGNAAYMQYITGTRIKFTIPNLQQLLNAPGYVKIYAASLLITPVSGTFNNVYSLPDTLRLTQTDRTNVAGADLTSAATAQTQTGNLYIDDLYGKDTRYTYDVTSYLQSKITASDYSYMNYGFFLQPFSGKDYTTFNRLVVGSQQQKTDRVQLVIYYISIQ
ncbi:DUF4270 family protein [Foetidibacter luteolus]|uniref:DUF4270 family protein n=1 Tax=Foetidibacter luteolus TaxID=2608880 RepID=UPI00129A4096|nr:DUF4270 family protein [Foetidibacter luteolus]